MVRVRTNRGENVTVHDELNRAVVDALGVIGRRNAPPGWVQHRLSSEASRSRRKPATRKLRSQHRSEHCRELGLGLGQLRIRIGVADHADARVEARLTSH